MNNASSENDSPYINEMLVAQLVRIHLQCGRPGLVLRSFNGLEPGGPESTDMKVKERKRLIFLGLRRKPIKHLHGACSFHEGLRCPLNGVKVQGTFSRGS